MPGTGPGLLRVNTIAGMPVRVRRTWIRRPKVAEYIGMAALLAVIAFVARTFGTLLGLAVLEMLLVAYQLAALAYLGRLAYVLM